MLVAFVAPLASFRIRSLRVPAILVEILLGMALGKSGLQVVETDAVIDYLAEFGFVFLMFLSAFELDFGPPGRSGRSRLQPWVQPGLLFALTLVLSLLGAEALHLAGLIRQPLLFALILSTTSVGVVLPTLKERGEVRTGYGQALVRAALVADLSTILLLTLFVLNAHHDSAGQIALPGLLAVAFVVVLVAGRRLGQVPILGRMLDELDHASTQIKVRGGLAVLVLFIVLAESLGAEAILSAFLAGLLVTLLAGDSRETLGHKLDAIGYGFFIPVFFVMVGVGVDVPALVADPRALLLVPLLVGVAFLVKLGPSLLILRNFGLRRSLAGGFLLSSRLALIIAASSVALDLGAIDVTVNTAVVLTAIITCLLSPMLYDRALGSPVRGRSRVVVAGVGRVGRRLVQRLAAHDVDVVVVDRAASQEAKLGADLVRFVVGDLQEPAVIA
ncbi:MAG: cation:proton antiporter, partial [Oligoflexia bacterium]|nr:cation:proton antiporter [Oligoflexia bacterium]